MVLKEELKMKKIFAITLVLILALSLLVACGGGNPGGDVAVPTTKPDGDDSSASPNDTQGSTVTPSAAQDTNIDKNKDITADFTDPAFLVCVREKVGKNNGEPILVSDVMGITKLLADDMGIDSLDGIEWFVSLKELLCDSNQLVQLDISKNAALTILSCRGNKLTKIDVGSNTSLEQLYCNDNQLTELDISKNTALRILNCNENELKELDINSNVAMETLRCSKNKLTALDVNNCVALKELSCYKNELTKLDVSKNTALTKLTCWGNPLTKQDIVGLDEGRTQVEID